MYSWWCLRSHVDIREKTTMKALGTIILASGYSKRFGNTNKLLMPLKNQSVIELTTAHLLDANVSSHCIVVTQYDLVAERFSHDSRVQVVMNDEADQGITASIKKGIRACEGASGYLFLPGDQVCIQSSTIKKLVEVFENNPDRIIVPVYQGSYGGPKIFPSSLKEELLGLKGDSGGRRLIGDHCEMVLEVPIANVNENRDIDTYEDYCCIREEFE